jgi:hypothetical protein
MIGFPGGVRIWLTCGNTDLRKDFDGLPAVAQTQLSEDPFSGRCLVVTAVKKSSHCGGMETARVCLPGA